MKYVPYSDCLLDTLAYRHIACTYYSYIVRQMICTWYLHSGNYAISAYSDVIPTHSVATSAYSVATLTVHTSGYSYKKHKIVLNSIYTHTLQLCNCYVYKLNYTSTQTEMSQKLGKLASTQPLSYAICQSIKEEMLSG